MKKFQKYLSFLCALAMILSSMLCTASAAGAAPSETTVVQVVVVDPVTNEQMTKLLNVAIPRGATKEEADALKMSAAQAAAGIITNKSARGSTQTEYFSDVAINTQAADHALIVMDDNYEWVSVHYEITANSGATQLSAYIITADNEGIPFQTQVIDGYDVNDVIMIAGDTYGDGVFDMGKDDTLRVMSKVNKNSIICDMTLTVGK